EPVYHNSQEGFRFVPPEGWTMRGRAEFPPGPQPQERLLVEYKRLPPQKPASLEVSMVDVAPAVDLAAWLQERAGEGGDWKPAGGVERVEVRGLAGARVVLTASSGGDNTQKEITAVRRGARVYSFAGIFVAADGRAREQVRKAVASVSF